MTVSSVPLSVDEKLRAVVVGLGRIGLLFDEEPGRKVIWTHTGAYLATASAFDVVGACDADPTAATHFRLRYPEIPVFGEVGELVAMTKPSVASICTPVDDHAPVLERLLDSPALKVVWCEKPLAGSASEAQKMVDACRRRGVHLVVSHVRRWLPLWQQFGARLQGGTIGRLNCLRIALPNRLWSMTSHGIDLVLMLGGPVRHVHAIDLPQFLEDGEPARAAVLQFVKDGYAIVQVTGQKFGLIVEVEAIGDNGRLFAREDNGTIRFERFKPSRHYQGYRELVEEGIESQDTLATCSPFTLIAAEMSALASGALEKPTCAGVDALAVMRVLDAMDRCEPGGTDLGNV